MSLRRVFTAGGAPFFPLGGQVHNSSAYRREDMAAAWRALELMHANTAEVPVYWEQVEPEEGRFDFSAVDWLLEDAAARGLRLVLLWFGTWKNGMMKYAPAWVKADTRRFRRVISAGGQPIAVLSSHCQATLDADRRAFTALMAHLRERDGAGTVIAVQVENEPGIIGSDRDYGPEAEAELGGPAPKGLVDVIAAAESSAAHAAWRAAGGRAGGSWLELFGEASAGEQLTAYSIARFCDAVAEAGRRAHDIPLYANVWLGEMGWRTPGASYPSGGATLSALEVWRWATPHLDLIAPDIYIQHREGFGAICAGYARPDNPLFIPESMPGPSNALTMLSAIADHGAIGYAVFGIESLLGPDGEPHPERKILVDTFRAVAAILPLVLAHQGTPGMRAIVQAEHQSWQYLDLGDYEAMALFASSDTGFVWRDFRHPPGAAERGRGLLVRAGEREFVACGGGYRLAIRPKQAPRAILASPHVNEQFLAPRLANYVLVEEGRFVGGAWAPGRRRNGDESDSGIWVTPDIGAVRVIVGE